MIIRPKYKDISICIVFWNKIPLYVNQKCSIFSKCHIWFQQSEKNEIVASIFLNLSVLSLTIKYFINSIIFLQYHPNEFISFYNTVLFYAYDVCTAFYGEEIILKLATNTLPSKSFETPMRFPHRMDCSKLFTRRDFLLEHFNFLDELKIPKTHEIQ